MRSLCLCGEPFPPCPPGLPPFQNRLTLKNAWRIEASGHSFVDAEEGAQITKDQDEAASTLQGSFRDGLGGGFSESRLDGSANRRPEALDTPGWQGSTERIAERCAVERGFRRNRSSRASGILDRYHGPAGPWSDHDSLRGSYSRRIALKTVPAEQRD